jgi:hypothetical protein
MNLYHGVASAPASRGATVETFQAGRLLTVEHDGTSPYGWMRLFGRRSIRYWGACWPVALGTTGRGLEPTSG